MRKKEYIAHLIDLENREVMRVVVPAPMLVFRVPVRHRMTWFQYVDPEELVPHCVIDFELDGKLDLGDTVLLTYGQRWRCPDALS